jgi:hypothetical protein
MMVSFHTTTKQQQKTAYWWQLQHNYFIRLCYSIKSLNSELNSVKSARFEKSSTKQQYEMNNNNNQLPWFCPRKIHATLKNKISYLLLPITSQHCSTESKLQLLSVPNISYRSSPFSKSREKSKALGNWINDKNKSKYNHQIITFITASSGGQSMKRTLKGTFAAL